MDTFNTMWLVSGGFIVAIAVIVATMWVMTFGIIAYNLVAAWRARKAAQVTSSPIPVVIEGEWEDVTFPRLVPGGPRLTSGNPWLVSGRVKE